MSDKYDDIRHLPYPLPNNRKRMSMLERAAQFSPFAALVGYENTIEETAKTSVGTDIIMTIKEDTEDDKFSEFLQEYQIRNLLSSGTWSPPF